MLAGALVLCVGAGPTLGVERRTPFEHDKKVCSTFAEYFKRENKLFAKDRQEIGAEGHNPGLPTVDEFVTAKDHGPWGGIEIPELTNDDPAYSSRVEIGYKARDIIAIGNIWQAFKADLFNDGESRWVIVFGVWVDRKGITNYVMVLKPNRPLEIQNRQNEYDSEMSIIGPKSDDVEIVIGQPGVAWDYNDLIQGNKINKPIDTPDSDPRYTVRRYFDDMYYLYQYHHLHLAGRSDFVYPGMKSVDSIRMVSKSEWIDKLIEGSKDWNPQKAYELGGKYYFVLGAPISPLLVPGEWEVYHLAPGLKVEVDCDFEPSAAVNRR